MKKTLVLISVLYISIASYSQIRTIHSFVALCDNQHQGIVPVPANIGNGKKPSTNLYWGAGYGVKNYFKVKTTDWKLVKTIEPGNPLILERLLYKHTAKNIYMLADAYDGEFIKNCIEDFLKASNGQNPFNIEYEGHKLAFGGASQLLTYTGHDGLMEHQVFIDYKKEVNQKRDVIILACASKDFFKPEIEKAIANPLLWTTNLLSPEAYTLKAAIDGWILNETGTQVRERAAQAYHKYQKCGINGARNLFTTGF